MGRHQRIIEQGLIVLRYRSTHVEISTIVDVDMGAMKSKHNIISDFLIPFNNAFQGFTSHILGWRNAIKV